MNNLQIFLPYAIVNSLKNATAKQKNSTFAFLSEKENLIYYLRSLPKCRIKNKVLIKYLLM